MSYPPEAAVRVLLSVIAVLGMLFAPWWVAPVCMLLLALRYPAWEVPVLGLMMDFLWLPENGHIAIPLFTIFGIVVVWILSPLRKQFLL